MSAESISKIHVTSSTGLSLNDRFTAMASTLPQQRVVRRRSRSRSSSRSASRNIAPRNSTSIANRRLLQQLARKQKMQTALKLKRRSMRTTGANYGGIVKRGSVKALRVAPNGKAIKTNSLARVATMNADLVANGGRGRPLRRANSLSNVVSRLGNNRTLVGGAARRIAKRQIANMRGNANTTTRRGRSRSRSRVRIPEVNNNTTRNVRARSMSRGRVSTTRGRSRSRSRNRLNAGAKAAVPIQARLGVRRESNVESKNRRGRRGTQQARRGIEQGSRGIQSGRIQKRRNSMTSKALVNAAQNVGVSSRMGRTRGRSRSRSRSRSRNGVVGQQQKPGSSDRGRQRGRSLQRRGGATSAAQRNGKAMGNRNGQKPRQQQKQQQQPRRGRSRGRGARGGGNLGKNNKPQVKKEDLDKELDQYMATTTKTDDIDYLLKA